LHKVGNEAVCLFVTLPVNSHQTQEVVITKVAIFAYSGPHCLSRSRLKVVSYKHGILYAN